MDYGLIKTDIGWCGALFSDRGVRNVVIGVMTRDRALRLLLGHHSKSTVSPQGPYVTANRLVKELLEMIKKYALGSRVDFSSFKLDMSLLTPFERSVLRATRRVPAGKTVTYQDIAESIGRPRAFRAVGRALSKNPFPIVVPCHRIIGSDGDLCGFSATGGTILKKKLLSIEREEGKKGPPSSLS